MREALRLEDAFGKLNAVQSATMGDFVPGRNHRLSILDRESGQSYLVDTGANISVFPVSRKQKLSGECSDYKLFAANNSEIRTYGTKTIKLNLGLRRSYTWTFVIADVSQAILGADFLKYYNLLVDINERKLIDKVTNLLTFGRILKCNDTSVSTVDNNHPFLDLLSEFSEITKPVSFKNLDRVSDNDVYHHIETTGKPVHARARPLPLDRYHKVKKEFSLMQEMGICRPSKSEWASPLHVVAKKDGNIRPVGDYRRLNAITKPDRYPVPRLNDFTYILAGKKIFTKIDINKAYHFVKIAPEDIEKTAVITPFGLFEFTRMNFGLKNASQTFQRFMNNDVLKGLDFLFSFIDDVIIASENMESHRVHLKTVFQRLREFGITINLSKCEFSKSSIEFLGYKVSTAGIEPLEDKVKAIVEYPRPQTIEQLRQFLGMINFYRASIPKAAAHQILLNDYLKGSKKKDKSKIEWTCESIQAFEQCKDSLKNAVMISHPVPNVPLSLMTDASDKCAGGVLQQWVNQSWLPLGYFSKKFTTAQQKYSTYDRELTAIFMAIKHFRFLFEGRELIIYTDHKPLIYAMNKIETNCETPRRTRQLLFISEFTTDIRYIKANNNNIADALSRVETITCPTAFDYKELAQVQDSDSELTQLLNEKGDNISLKKIFIPNSNKTVYCENSTNVCRPYIPESYRKLAFKSVHDNSHPGVRATRKLMAQRFFWPGLNRDVGQWAKTCIQCQKSKVGRHTISELQQFPEADRLAHIHVDIVGPLPPTTEGYRYLVTMIDRCTRWPEAIPVSDITAEVIAKVLYNNWITRFGVPDRITSDQGRQFESNLFNELLKILGIEKSRSSPYRPQSNGIVERWHRSMKQAITARLTGNTSWYEELPTVLLGLRSVGRSDNNVSPAEYIYGQTLRLPGDFYNVSDNWKVVDNVFLSQLRNNISKLKPVPREIRDSRTLFVHSELGKCEYVFIRNDAVRRPLTAPYDGPYRVVKRKGKVFKIQLPNRMVNISIDRLKPAFVLNDQNSNQTEENFENSTKTNVEDLFANDNIKNNDSKKVTKSGRVIRLPVRFNC